LDASGPREGWGVVRRHVGDDAVSVVGPDGSVAIMEMHELVFEVEP
jgi:hypothetical protein